MLITNSGISDRLINSQLGQIYDFKTNIGTVPRIYLSFDNNAAGLKTIQMNFWQAKTHNALPISRIKVPFVLSKNTCIYNQAN